MTSAELLTYREFSLIPVLGLNPELQRNSPVGNHCLYCENCFYALKSLQFQFHFPLRLSVSRKKICVYIKLKQCIQQIPLLNSLKCKLNSLAFFFFINIEHSVDYLTIFLVLHLSFIKILSLVQDGIVGRP